MIHEMLRPAVVFELATQEYSGGRHAGLVVTRVALGQARGGALGQARVALGQARVSNPRGESPLILRRKHIPYTGGTAGHTGHWLLVTVSKYSLEGLEATGSEVVEHT